MTSSNADDIPKIIKANVDRAYDFTRKVAAMAEKEGLTAFQLGFFIEALDEHCRQQFGAEKWTELLISIRAKRYADE